MNGRLVWFWHTFRSAGISRHRTIPTVATDTGLHRIVEAMDAHRSTGSSHQRTFVVEDEQGLNSVVFNSDILETGLSSAERQ